MPVLDALRPHLARAAMLASQLGLERAKAAVTARSLTGVAAALLSRGRRLVAANDLFHASIDSFGDDTPSGLALADADANAQFERAVALVQQPRGSGASLPLRTRTGHGRVVLHLLPIRGVARDKFSGATAVLLVASPGARRLPTIELIQSLLDLTPAEARLARDLADANNVAEAAAQEHIALATARTQLKRIFAKTGIRRQTDLVSLLSSVARPKS